MIHFDSLATKVVLASTLAIGVATGGGITGSGCGVQSIGTRVGAVGS